MIQTNLAHGISEYKQANPQARSFDIAQELGVPEPEILLHDSSVDFIPLQGDPLEILKRFDQAGVMMALTRNKSVVHELHGVYQGPSFHGMMGTFTENLDLRLHFHHWKYAAAIVLKKPDGDLPGILFFNSQGDIIHKSYFIEESNPEVYHELVREFGVAREGYSYAWSVPESSGFSDSLAGTVSIPEDRQSFLDQWSQLQDSHHFAGLLRKNRISRLSALHGVEGEFADQLGVQQLPQILRHIRDKEVACMYFVGNPGMIQIFTGKIKKVSAMKGWFNIFEPEFNLHVHVDTITSVWKVFKPNRDGGVHSIEAYDAEGQIVLQIFGKRKPGIPEAQDWIDLVKTLPIGEIEK